MIPGPTQISWNANTESDLAGYKLYIGRATGTYTQPGSPIDVGLVTTYTYTVDSAGSWFFALTAYNSAALESSFSSELVGAFTGRLMYA